MIQSFYQEILREVKKKIPELKVSYLYKGEFKTFGMDKVLKHFSFLHKFLWIPDYKKAYKVVVEEGFNYFSPNIQQLNFLMFDKNFKIMLDVFEKEAKPFEILPWTVNTKRQVQKFGNYYKGVITDHPERFLQSNE